MNVSVLDDNNSVISDFEFDFAEDLEDDRAFIILNDNGEFRFREAPDYETPLDGDGNRVYTFTVVATSQSNSDFTVTEEINLRVTDVPEFIGAPAPEVPAPPEAPTPEVPVPEIPVPEVPAPEAAAPEAPSPTPTPTPEDPTPEDPAPEDSAPEDSAPEDSAPEAPAPEDPAPAEDEEEFGRVQTIPEVLELESSQQAIVEESGSQVEDARAGLLLDYDSDVYSYAGRTQFLDLAKQELSVISSEALQSNDDFSQQLTLSQFVVGPEVQDISSSLDISNWNLGDFTPPIFGAGLITVAIATAATLTSSQIPRVLDFGQLLDDEESIEEIVSS